MQLKSTSGACEMAWQWKLVEIPFINFVRLTKIKYFNIFSLGALDGSPNTRSMTYEYEASLGWKRILVDAVRIFMT